MGGKSDCGQEYNSDTNKKHQIAAQCDFLSADRFPSLDPGFHAIVCIYIKQETEQADQIQYPHKTTMAHVALLT